MKVFTALLFLAAFSFLVEAKTEGLRPLNIVMPAVPHNQTEEWRTNMAAQVPSPKQFPSFKNDTKSEPDHRITNGQPARRGQFPWQVAVFIENTGFCGGSLISDTWILTAAHCTYNASYFTLLLGTINLFARDNGYVTQISIGSTVHGEYNNETFANDIALIKLLQPVEFSLYISSIRLPSRSQANTSFEGATLQCSGWGRVSDTILDQPATLQYADMSVITNSNCMVTWGSGISGKMICVSTADRRSPCRGDSGGPLVFREDDGRYTEVGIVSFGHKSGCENGFPAVFTRVTSYLNWIQRNTDIVIA